MTGPAHRDHRDHRADVQIIVLSKEPVAGAVKTRLTPPYSPEAAAGLAFAALQDTIEAVRRAPVARRFLALDGDAEACAIPDSIEVLKQRGNGLAQRIENALFDAMSATDAPTLLIGMDTPQVTGKDLAACTDELLAPDVDAVLGLAEDGGFWALGLRRWMPGLVRGVQMSTGRTGGQQLSRLHAAGLRLRLLPTMRDVDTAHDAALVACAAPASLFAQALRDADVSRRAVSV